MSGIKSYILALITICVSAGIVTQAAPEGQLKKYIKYIVSLCVLAALIAPVISVFGNLGEYTGELESIIQQQTEIYPDAQKQIIEAQKKSVEEAIRSLISSKYSIEKDNIKVEIKIDSSNTEAIEIKEISVLIYEKTNTADIKNYLNEMFYGTAKIAVGEAEGG